MKAIRRGGTRRTGIIGFPLKDIESDWLDEVRRFLEDNQENHFKVYNLCSERSSAKDRYNLELCLNLSMTKRIRTLNWKLSIGNSELETQIRETNIGTRNLVLKIGNSELGTQNL